LWQVLAPWRTSSKFWKTARLHGQSNVTSRHVTECILKAHGATMLVGPISPLLHFWILPAQKNTKNVARPKNQKNKFVWGSRRVSLHTCPYTHRNTKG
jgi:hypothetical protein